MTTKVMIKNVRVSYVHVFEPSAITDGAKEKYSVSILIRPDDKANLDAINAAVNEAYAEGLKNPKIWNGKQPVLFKHPLRNGNEKDPDKNPEYVGMFFIGANSDDKPLVVNRSREVISSSSEFYSGCYANVLVNFYPYKKAGNNGVACGLKGCQFVSHGEALGGGGASANDFEELDEHPTGFPQMPTM